MKTRYFLIGVAMAAALNCAAAQAQVLGGGLGGGLNGALSGGLRDMSMTSQGSLNGSLGADLDTSTLRRTTRDTTEHVTNRARNTTTAVRDRAAAKVDQTREQVGETQQAAVATTSAAAATAASAVNDVQIEGAADIAGSATSNLTHDGLNVANTTQGASTAAVHGSSLPRPDLTNATSSKLVGGETANVSNLTQPAKDATPTQTAAPSKDSAVSGLLNASDAAGTNQSGSADSKLLSASNSAAGDNAASSGAGLLGMSGGTKSSSTGSALVDAPKAKEAAAPAQPEGAAKPATGLSLSGDAKGSASASRSGVSADGGGSMTASRK